MPLRAIAPFVGLNTQENESILLPTEGTVVKNINLDKGTIKRRDGWSQVSDSSGVNTGAILGLYDFRRTSGGDEYNTHTLIKAGTSLWRRNDDEGFENIGSGALTANTLADFAIFENIAYIADAGAFKATDGTDTFNAVITRPTDVPTVAVTEAADGLLNGFFDWKYTWYSPTYKQESPSSPFTETSKTHKFKLGSKATLSDLPDAKPDTRDDDDTWVKRIYRRNHSLGQTEWLLVGTATRVATTFVDNIPEHLVSTTQVAPLSSTIPLNGIRNIEEHRGVMFMAKDDCLLYFSKPEQPHSVTEYISVGGDAEKGKITGLLSWKGLLYVFKEESIWAIDGLTRDTITARQIVTGIGCYSGHSIIADNRGVYFLGEDAFYVFDGQSVAPISDPIKTTVIDRNRSRDRFVVGVADKENRAFIWTYSPAGVSTNTECLVFFEGNSGAVERPSWATWSFNDEVNYLARITTDDTTADRVVWYGFNDGNIGEPSATGGDNGAVISAQWFTGKIDFGEPTRHKAWTTLYLEQEKQGAFSGLQIFYEMDSSGITNLLDEIDSQNPINYLRIRERARDIKFLFIHTDQNPIEIGVFTIDAELAGIYHRER